MISEFDQFGNLPEGVHSVSEREFLDRFASGSPRRQWLGAQFRDLLAMAKATGKVERVYLWGSFVTAKEAPRDLDLLIVVSPDFDLDAVAEAYRVIFDHARARLRFNADVFWTRSSIGSDAIDLLLETYQTTRDYRRRGIVEVTLQ